MKYLFDKIHKQLEKTSFKKIILKNKKLTTHIFNYYRNCDTDLTELSNAFNSIFGNESKSKLVKSLILQDNSLFKDLDNFLSNMPLFETNIVKNFNNATKSSSIVKCSNDGVFYIMKCYDYFFYLFDKNSKECIMVLNTNKKAITMVNILLLTPYLMYGELNAIHGGLVSKNNQTVLINNTSLGGKTTFAILFAQNGWNIITEENTYISKSGKILPYNIRNYFNIRVGTYLAFEKFFLKKGIIYEPFLSMKGKSTNELFEYGKNNQLSITFKEIGKDFDLNNQKITHSLKVSILKDSQLIISKGTSQDLINSFIEISKAPTVELFRVLLDFKTINLDKIKNNLSLVLKDVKNFTIQTGLDYKENFEYIKKRLM